MNSVSKKTSTGNTFFRFEADIIPCAVIVALFVLDLFVYFAADSLWQLVLWLSIAWFPKICICSWNHHHQHLHTFYQPTLNRLLELVYAFHTGITTNAWVLHHNLGHHLHYLDQNKDESGWKRKNGTVMGEWEYTIWIAITGYIRAFRVGRKHPKYQTNFITMGMVVFVLLCGLFYLNWLNALFVFLIPMVIGYVVTCWHTYSHHAGLDSDNHLEASHNVLHKWYNIFTGNLGLHTAHHMKPGLHWSMLPEYHKQIAPNIPQELFIGPPLVFYVFGRKELTL